VRHLVEYLAARYLRFTQCFFISFYFLAKKKQNIFQNKKKY